MMKKLFLLLLPCFLFTGVQNLYSSVAEERLNAITDEIPSNWWDGGWNKLEELEYFIYRFPGETALCAKAQYYIGCYYHSKQEYPKAIKEYGNVLELYPSVTPVCSNALFQMGQITLLSLNKPKEGLEYYRQANEICPDNCFAPECQLMIGRACLKLGDTEKARIAFQKVLDNYPAATWQKNDARADLQKLSEDGKQDSLKTKGELTFPKGRYEGEIEHGRMNGKGVLVCDDGDRYEGEFLENNFQGKGIFTWADGDRYEGDFVLSKHEGNGKLTYNTGDVYEGQFKYDLYNGKGTFYSANLYGEKSAKSGLWYLGQYMGKDEDGSADIIPTKDEDIEEEKRIAEILNENNLSQISHVDEILKFADKLLEEGFESKAMALYEAGLASDTTRLDYQLKLARLALKKGRIEDAAASARAVYEYAENDEMIDEAESILKKTTLAGAVDISADPEMEPGIEIVLVTVGSASRNITEEAARIMHKKLGLAVSAESEAMELPAEKSRDTTAILIGRAMTEIIDGTPEDEMDKLLAEWGGSRKDLNNYEGQKSFIEFAMKKEGKYDAEVFNELFKPKLQYCGDIIIEKLRKKYDVRPSDRIKGYIGITSADIYTGDYNTISFTAAKKYAIVSYYNYSGEANYEPQNRNLLVNRMSKAGIFAALSVMRVPHCSTPYCVNSNCNSVELRDKLSLDLCEKCKSSLADYKKRMKQ